ncbi:hypothetical protein NM688_g1966 [Phlebia brevispora]|uniref:Uncharacterized protein n=1 Tax=Phlebia brevispora TaxID=194682 RepID=A0ACC1TA81_9APHY|nr:hypothetical protein NM688_g1966 [Phlebia brevispora]
MSDAVSNSALIAEAVANVCASTINRYTAGIAITLASYEYILLFREEVDFLLKHKQSGVTWVFLANRYIMMAQCLMMIVPSNRESRCSAKSYVEGTDICDRCTNRPLFDAVTAIGLLPAAITAIFGALRVFALLDRAYIMAILTLTLGLVPVVTNFYFLGKTTLVVVEDLVLGLSCYADYSISDAATLYIMTPSLGLATRLSVVIADLIIIAVTWRQTHQHLRQIMDSEAPRSVGATVLQDGSVYFIALLVLNVIQLLVDTIPAFEGANPVFNITAVMSPILISRFLINLRRAGTTSRFHVNSSLKDDTVVTTFLDARYGASTGGLFTSIDHWGEHLTFGVEMEATEEECPRPNDIPHQRLPYDSVSNLQLSLSVA